MLLDAIPARGAGRHPDRSALITDDARLTYADLEAAVERVARRLSGATRPGDRVAVVAENSAAYVVWCYAVPRAGRVLALLNQRLHPAELAAAVERTGASLVAGDRGLLDALRSRSGCGAVNRWWALDVAGRDAPGEPSAGGASLDRDEQDPAWLIHTSGTTGQAKGVVLSHANLSAAISAGGRGRPVRDDDVYLFPFPLCHVAGYNVALQHRHGATVVVPRRFDPAEVVRAIADHGITTLSLAPTMIARLLDEPALADADLSGVRSIGYGASPIGPDLLRRALERFDCDLVQGYGMTELSGNAAFLDGDAHRRAVSDRPDLLTAAGRPDPNIDIRVADDDGRVLDGSGPGEIVARGPQVFSGYWNDPQADAAAFVDGWFRTGDVGRFDAEGLLHVVDRKKDLIVTGGENVASREVEDVLAGDPSVAEVAVIGLPHDDWGEQVTAVVVPAPGCDIDPDALVRRCRGSLAGFKRPRRVEVADDLELTASGKIDKAALRRRFTGPG